MEYITVKEAAEKWGISERLVQKYCAEGRIGGARNSEDRGDPAGCGEATGPAETERKGAGGSAPVSAAEGILRGTDAFDEYALSPGDVWTISMRSGTFTEKRLLLPNITISAAAGEGNREVGIISDLS